LCRFLSSFFLSLYFFMTQTIQAIKGMQDFLPAETALLEQLEETVRSWMRSYGYQNIRTPIVEPTALFTRGLGQVTDIVEKEMYSFVDSMNGDALTLRPENTAGVVRAVIESSLVYDGAKRLWYMGPMFRHEKPQRGRYRQFHQIGAEAVGFTGPDLDAELIVMCQRLWDDLGLEQVRLEVNSIGDARERAAHREQLIAYFEGHSELLDAEAKRRLHSNPLRILDTKNPAMQAMVNAAPKLMDHLGDESRAHFDGVLALLRSANVPYKINPRLVRGMDYYNRTVFEWVSDRLGSQGTICGGGRYDPLTQMYGGKPTPACGFAIGVERLVDLWKQSGQGPVAQQTDVYVIHQGVAALPVAFVCAEELRANGFDVILNGNGGSFKAQFKRADASGAQFAVVIGDDEVKSGRAVIKALRTSDAAQGEQIHVSLAQLSQELSKLLVGAAA
jgi:histidyl-tRNA synthetase